MDLTPPSHLLAASQGFWARTQAQYAITDDAGLQLLTLACEQLDRAESARDVLRNCGLTYTDRFGAPRPRPEVAIERNATLAYGRMIRELGLQVKE